MENNTACILSQILSEAYRASLSCTKHMLYTFSLKYFLLFPHIFSKKLHSKEYFSSRIISQLGISHAVLRAEDDWEQNAKIQYLDLRRKASETRNKCIIQCSWATKGLSTFRWRHVTPKRQKLCTNGNGVHWEHLNRRQHCCENLKSHKALHHFYPLFHLCEI